MRHIDCRRTAPAILAALGSLTIGACLAPAAWAASDADPPRVIVKYDAAASATESGARALFLRLAAAARRVCPDAVQSSLQPSAAVRECRRLALARAVSDARQPRLVEIAAGRGRRG
jgi:UrcA family protein